MDLTSTLKSIGLNDKEIRVYLACLELGAATIHEVADKSGVKRTTIYYLVEEMKQKSLISEIKKGNVVLLAAEDPEAVLAKVEENVKKFRASLPELKSIYNQPAHKPKVKFYEGFDGIMQTYEDTLIEGEPIFAFSDFEKIMGASPKDRHQLWDYVARRTEKKIPIKTFTREGEVGREMMKRDPQEFRETKMLKGVSFDTEINIYGKKVALTSFRKPYTGVIIEDPAIAKTLKTIWNLLWEKM